MLQKNKSKSKGFSFIEVMISLLLMSLILFGVNAAHLLALNEAKTAYYFLLASKQAKMLADNLAKANASEWPALAALFNRNINQMLPNGHMIIPHLEQKQLIITWGMQGMGQNIHDDIGKSGSLIFNLSKLL